MQAQTDGYTDIVRRKIENIEHWELFTLMALTGLAILTLYLMLALIAYPLFAFIPESIYLILSIIAGIGLATFSVRRTVKSLRAEAEPLSWEEYPDLFEKVERLCKELEMPVPDLYLKEGEVNAMAIGDKSNGAIILNLELIELMSDEELEAILAHELAHLYYRDSIILIATNWIERGFRYLAWAFAYVMIVLANTIEAMARERPETEWEARNRIRRQQRATALMTGIAGGLVLLPRNALSRYREFVADHTAADLVGKDAMVGGLEKLRAHEVDPDVEQQDGGLKSTLGPVSYSDRPSGIRGRFRSVVYGTHPSTDRRIEALEYDFGNSYEEPSPIEQGPTLGSLTRFGLTFAPALIVAAPIAVIAGLGIEGVTGSAFVTDPHPVLGFGIAIAGFAWFVSLFTFCWAMLFAAGGTPKLGAIASVCLLLFLFSGGLSTSFGAFEIIPLVGYLGLAGVGAIHLRDVIEELQ